MKDPEGAGPNISLSQSPEGPLADYRLHLDPYSTDAEAEVERLVRLGATLKRPRRAGEDFTTLADPDGNPFDVIWREGLKFGKR